MPRLPQPGGDKGTWGDLLNEFLSQSHNTDGSLKSSSLASAGGASNGSVVHNTGDEAIAGRKTFSSSPVVPAPSNATDAVNKTYVDSVAISGAPDADAGTKGLIQLTGDLSGTAVSPVIANNAVTSAKIADGTITNADINASAAIAQSKIANLTSDLTGKAPLASPTFTGTVTVPDNSFSAAKLSFNVATQAELTAHINDTSAVHAASAISFTPTGSIASTDVQGAIIEVVSDTAKSDTGVYNVKGYGAVGNGTADDTTAVQNAINAASGAGGGIVLFTPGTYLCSTLTLPSRVAIVGSGVDATILKLKDATNAALIRSTGFSGLTGGTSSGGTHSWAVKNLSIDGNKANNTAGCGIQVYGYGFAIEHVRIHDCDDHGIWTQWGTELGAVSPHDMTATFLDVHSHDNDGDGFYYSGPHDSIFNACMSYRNGGNGFTATGAGHAATMIGCHSWGIDQLWAYYLGTTGNILTGSTGEGAGTSSTVGGQVFIGANDNSISGGHYYSANVDSGNRRGIVIGDDTHTSVGGTHIDTKVTGCKSGSYILDKDAGSYIAGLVYQESGNVYTGTINVDTQIILTVTGSATYGGHLLAEPLTVKGLGIPTGANARMGTATLVNGKAQIYTNAVTDNSVIFVTPTIPGGTVGILVARNIGGTDRLASNWFFVSSMVEGSGSLQSADTSTFNWLIIEG